MKHILKLLTALILLSPLVAAQSEWAARISGILPANVSLTNVEESDRYITITGTAKDNSDISALMRAVQNSKLGDPQLEQIKRTNNVSHFILRIKLRT